MTQSHILFFCFELNKNSVALSTQTTILDELSKRALKVTAVTYNTCNYTPPKNVTIIVPESHFLPFFGRISTWKKIKFRHKESPITTAYVHMAYRWILYFGPLLRLNKIPIILWYAHNKLSKELKFISKFVHTIVTSSDEGFPLITPKRKIIGQTIKTKQIQFSPNAYRIPGKLITVSRISRSKQIHKMVDMLNILIKSNNSYKLHIIGEAIDDDSCAYYREIKQHIKDLGLNKAIIWHGYLNKDEIGAHLIDASLFINLSNTGSLDKAILEAMAAGTPCLTSNNAFKPILKNHICWLEDETPKALSDRVEDIKKNIGLPDLQKLRKWVERHHDIDIHMDKLMSLLNP